MIAIYVRQSVDKKDSISIESQIDFCKREISNDEAVKIYQDRGYSGKNTERPDFQRLVTDVRNKRVNTVIVYRLDRMSRSILDFSNLMDVFQKCSVEFISCTEKFDTSTPIGRAMLSIVMTFAQLERETTAERVKDNYYDRVKKGIFMGGSVPFGYDLVPHKIGGISTKKFVHNSDAEIMKKIYKAYATQDTSLNKITKSMNSDNIKTTRGKFWYSNKISVLMKNPIYAKNDTYMYEYLKNQKCIIENKIEDFDGKHGLYVVGDKSSGLTKNQSLEGYIVAIAPHSGLIDGKTWVECRNKLNSNKSLRNTGKSEKSWLSGLVRCQKCGYAMTVNSSSRLDEFGNKRLYFRCIQRTAGSDCTQLSVPVKQVEASVKIMITDYLKSLKIKLEEQTNEDNDVANKIKLQIATKENEISNLIDSISSSSSIAVKYISDRIDKVDSELSLLKKQLSEEITNKEIFTLDKLLVMMKLLSKWETIDFDSKKQLAKTVIENIHLADEQIRVSWKY